MSLSKDDYRLLHAAEICGSATPERYCKCASVLRHALEVAGISNAATDYAISNTGYDDPKVAHLYDRLRALIADGFLEGRGNLSLPAGPRYTECRITAQGTRQLQDILESES